MTDPTRQTTIPDGTTTPAQPVEPSFEDIPVVTTTTPTPVEEPDRLTAADIDRLGGNTTAEPTTLDMGATPAAGPNDGVRLTKQRRWYDVTTQQWVEGQPPEGYDGPFEDE